MATRKDRSGTTGGRRHEPTRNLGARAVRLLHLSAGPSPLLVVARDMRELRDLAGLLRAFAPGTGVAAFPEWDCLPYDHVSPSTGVMGERAGTLRWLASPGSRPGIVLTTVPALCQRVPPPGTWAGAHIEVRPSDPFDPEVLSQGLARLGYLREERVDEPGQFALHGRTVDIFPAAAARPCRIAHEDGRVTEIRSYELGTQLSLVATDLLIVDPASEIILGEDAGERPPPFSGEEHRLARFYPRLATLFDYLPEARWLLDREADERAEPFFEQVAEGRRIAAREAAGDALYLDPAEWAELAASREQAEDDGAGAEDLPVFTRERRPAAALARFVSGLRDGGERVLLSGDGPGLRRLARALKAPGTSPRPVAEWVEALEAEPGALLSLETPLGTGFRLPDRKVTVVAAADLTGRAASAEQGATISSAAIETDLHVGDVAVDRENGLCVFEGLETVGDGQDAGSEALRLRFADDDVLMLPVAQADRIWRYGSEPEAVSLDRLDGGAWDGRRQKLEAGIARTARAMVALAEARAAARVPPLVPDHRAMARFAAGFRFDATPDQAAAIDSVLADLASGRPMDRLVCGDVGFGKTEVALRAVAAAVFAGRQAAVVAPTTVLVRQHVETFSRRFARFGIEVVQLSRLATPAEARRAKEALAEGRARIVIGTQALAGAGVRFADLGLVVIDEEQRFGAGMKARLRALGQAGASAGGAARHVLTLTATPIPRTLEAALSGLHALSLLKTPPAMRQPIRTIVSPFDPRKVGEALLRERARGGQSFVVCPRIEDLEPVADQLAAAAPGLAVTMAHGGMKPAEMDDRMVRFAGGEGDVLLATSIIESGLDVPRANTMVVYRANLFGLAELHQLRGRVGRGRRRGLVHLTTDPAEAPSPAAVKRLGTIRSLDRLGAGFAIAARDLDLRGAGDLVGEEQAGHVQKIGLGLYQHLLELALRKAKGRPTEDWSPEIVLPLHGSVPQEFVPDAETRLALYIRLLRARSPDEIEAWRTEVEDRFGPPPPAVEDLVRIAGLRARCRRLGIARLSGGPRGLAADLRRPMRRPGSTGPVKRLVSAAGSEDPGDLVRRAEGFLRRLERSGPSSRRTGTREAAGRRERPAQMVAPSRGPEGLTSGGGPN